MHIQQQIINLIYPPLEQQQLGNALQAFAHFEKKALGNLILLSKFGTVLLCHKECGVRRPTFQVLFLHPSPPPPTHVLLLLSISASSPYLQCAHLALYTVKKPCRNRIWITWHSTKRLGGRNFPAPTTFCCAPQLSRSEFDRLYTPKRPY